VESEGERHLSSRGGEVRSQRQDVGQRAQHARRLRRLAR
jgi:hypothetical protein